MELEINKKCRKQKESESEDIGVRLRMIQASTSILHLFHVPNFRHVVQFWDLHFVFSPNFTFNILRSLKVKSAVLEDC